MTGEQIFGLIMIIGVSGGCGLMFAGIGLWATRSKSPSVSGQEKR